MCARKLPAYFGQYVCSLKKGNFGAGNAPVVVEVPEEVVLRPVLGNSAVWVLRSFIFDVGIRTLMSHLGI